MNRKAIINGREYTLLEIVPSLDGGQALLLCEDENGKRAVCSEPLWRSCALTDVQSAPVHAHSSSQEKIEYFLSVFKGREDVYAICTPVSQHHHRENRLHPNLQK